jgi:hypothetical protein
MSGFFFVLAMLLLFASSVFGIWMLVIAFRTGVLWGLAVLFVPFAVLVFAITHWDECKKPFLLQLGTSVAAFMLIFLTVGAAVGEAADMAAEEQARMSASEKSQDVDWEKELSKPSSAPAEPYAGVRAPLPTRPAPSVRVTQEPRRTLPGGKIQLGRAREYLGERVRVTAHDGRTMQGDLIDVSGDRLIIEKELSAGFFSFDVARSEVRSLELIGY